LLTVAVCAVDVAPTVCVKLRVVGETPITGLSATPVPDRLVLLVPPLALCVTVRVALRAPADDGVKLMLIVQLPDAATDPPTTHEPPLTANSVLLVESVARVNGAVPVFISVAVCAVLGVPTLTLPNASEAVSDATGAAAAVALPLRLTLPGLPVALWATDSEPLRTLAAPAAGLNATETVQLEPAATLPPALQVPPAMVKSAVLLRLIAEIANAALPLLATLTFCAALVPPMAVAASVSALGVMLAIGAAGAPLEPVPLNVITIGVSVLLCEMLSVPVRAPVAVGVKVTSSVQLRPAPTAVAQVPPERAKSPLAETARPLIADDAPFRLALTVTVSAADVAPTAVDAKLSVLGAVPR